MKYYIIAGEPSGDLHGANLMQGLQKADHDAQFRFWGGDRMAEVGGAENLAKHYRETSFFGFAQVVMNLRTIMRQMRECKQDILRYAPDAVILIDYPGFNLSIAKFAHAHSLRTFYYIAPKVWAWKESRIKLLRRYVDELFIIFPFEREYFRKRGIEAHFEGNPLVDAIAARSDAMPSREEFLQRNSLPDKPIIALLAGSRRTEIKANLPDMATLARRFPDHTFVVAGVEWIDAATYRRYATEQDVKLIFDQTYSLLHHSEAAIVTSGTATLETALMGIPELVLYKIPRLYEILRPYVLSIPYVSLVNINLGKEAVREIVTARFDADDAQRYLASILCGGSRRAEMLANFDHLRAIIGDKGASERFATRMVELLKSPVR